MANTVDRKSIRNGSINSGKIASGSITSNKIANNAIMAKHLSAEAITAVQISASDIQAITLAASQINANNIAANSIDGSKITADTITSDRLKANVLSAINANITTLNAGLLNANNTITTNLTSLNATITKLNALDVTVSGNFTAANASINNLKAETVSALNLKASKAYVDDLAATKATVTNLNAAKADIATLTTDLATANTLIASKASITNLTSQIARIDSIISGAISVGTVSAGGVGASAIAAGAITASALATNFILTKSVTSPNFNGSISNGVINAGTTGYCLDSSTGTLIVNSLIARDGVISGNYIKTDLDSGFSVKNNGSLSINPDNQTIGVTNGVVTVKQIPSSLIVNESTGIDFIGGTNGRARMSNSYHVFNAGSAQSYLQFQFPILLLDTLDVVTSPLLISNITTNNLKLDVDYSGISNIANSSSLYISFNMNGTASTSSFVDTSIDNGFNTRYIYAGINPILPQATKSYFLPKLFDTSNAQLGIISNGTNRYVLLSAKIQLFCPYLQSSDRVTMFLPSDPTYSISITANGTVESSTKLFASYVLPSNYQFTF